MTCVLGDPVRDLTVWYSDRVRDANRAALDNLRGQLLTPIDPLNEFIEQQQTTTGGLTAMGRSRTRPDHRRQALMPKTAASPLVLVACAAMLLAAACGEAAPIARTAAQRIDEAVALIAKTLGKDAGEVRTGIRIRLPVGATDEEFAVQAERTAAKTAAMQRLAEEEAARIAAREAQQARLQEEADTIYGATCDWLDIADEMASQPGDQRVQAFQEILVKKLAAHAFKTDQENMNTLRDEVQSLINSTSSPDRSPAEIATDLACFAS